MLRLRLLEDWIEDYFHLQNEINLMGYFELAPSSLIRIYGSLSPRVNSFDWFCLILSIGLIWRKNR